MLRALVLDDEPNCSKTMELLLKEFCPQVMLLDTFNHPQKAIEFLKANSIDLLFLDIDMPAMNGFELLDIIQPVNFHIIFTTAYDQYAIRAFKYSAYDYLLKPIDEAELAAAVERLVKVKKPDSSKTVHLLSVYNDKKKNAPERIALPTTDGFEFITTSEIIRCESDSNYTRLFFTGNKAAMLVCRTLKDIENIIGTTDFLRVHNSHLINKKQVKKLIKTDGGFLLMNDDSQVPVARSRKTSIMNDLLS